MQRVKDMVAAVVRAFWLAVLVATGAPALAQGSPFSPAVIVNGRAVTFFELDQRALLFSLLEPGIDAAAQARASLIDDRLRQQAAEAAEVSVPEAALAAGMEEFASRAKLTADEFIAALAERGVARETFRDFVLAGLLWREAVRVEFLATTQVSEREIDRAIAGGIASGGALKVLLSELVIPTGGVTDAMELALRIKGDVATPAGFAAAARVHSSAPSAAQGGVLDWAELSALPPQIAAIAAPLAIGQMSDPIALDGAVTLLFMRDRSATGGEAPGAMTLDFVTVPAASALPAATGICPDALALGRGLPEEAVQRRQVPQGQIGGALGSALAGLDAGESAAYTSEDGQRRRVMLCARTPLTEFPASREDVRGQLLNQKMAIRAQSHLEKLRAEAHIVGP